jgi:hypothetical protein
MLERGYTPDGAAQALGWAKARVTARVKLLQLPEAAERMVGDGRIALAAVEHLLAIGDVSSPLLQAVVAYVGEPENAWAAGELARSPGRVVDEVIRDSDTKPVAFAQYLSTISGYQLQRLQLGKTAEKLITQAGELDKKLRGYSSGAEVRFAEVEVDRARAAGVLIEFDEQSWPIIVDRKLYRQLTRDALKRTLAELEQRVTTVEADRKAQRQLPAAPVTAEAAAEREKSRQLSAIAQDAHGANLDLGRELIGGLATVDPQDMTVARFFVYALLGSDRHAGSYTEAGKQAHHLAMYGLRYVVDEFRTDVTKTRKDGSQGKLRIDYGKPSDSATGEPVVKSMWKFVDGARTAGDLYGRALVVIAAEHYASQLVVPISQRGFRASWGSHKDLAIKALEKLAGPHLPASLKAIETAVKKANADCERVLEAEHARRRAECAARRDTPTGAVDPDTADAAEPADATGDAEQEACDEDPDGVVDGEEADAL